jgi:hypothetical protein
MNQPSDEEIRLAKIWWANLPSIHKGNWSIWTILALYAEYTLQTRTVHFDGDQKAAKV